MERPFSIVKSNDGKCLHKENGELSFRNCDNVKKYHYSSMGLLQYILYGPNIFNIYITYIFFI